MSELSFEGIDIGSQIPPLVKRVGRKELVMYSAATWDFHPGHYDREFARSQGFKDVYMDGPMAAAFMAQAVTAWTGCSGRLRSLDIIYKTMAFAGDTLTCAGSVAEKKPEARRVQCDLVIANQEGKTVATGRATVEF